MRRALALLVGAAAASGAYAARDRLPDRVRARWERISFAGTPLTMLEGPAYTLGALGGLAGGRGGAGAAVALVGAACAGALDDLRGSSSAKGLRGHLGALADGQVTTGALKIVGIGASALVGAALMDRGTARGSVSTLAGAGLVAGAANLGNLLDLRPGRALKAVVLAGFPLTVTRGAGALPAAAAVGAAVGVLSPDLRGESMLGDTGANAAGALVGFGLAERLGTTGRLGALLLLTAATVASEKVSFTEVIERTPGLRELDAWGRPPR